MKQELQEKLFSKYPKIFGDRTKPMTETCMCWGIETGCGWYDIIDTLCQAITNTYSTSLEIDEVDAKHLGVEPYKFKDEVSYIYSVNCPQVVAQQVKEKFGGLRFYVATGNADVYELIRVAGEESFKICEECGTRENVNTEGKWLKTLCPKCRKKNEK